MAAHTLVGQDDVVLRRDVVRQVVVENEAQQAVEQCQVDLLVYLGQNGLHHDVALALAGLPDVRQVVDTLAPLIHQERRRLGVCRLDPSREEATFVRLEEQELVEVLWRTLSTRIAKE